MRRLLPIILLALSLAAGTWLGMRPATRLPAGPLLKVYFLNVGQGDCSLLQTPDHKNILIDAGEEDIGPDVVRFLESHEVKRIDLLVMTHPHSDHIGGVPSVMDAFPIGKVLDSAYPYGSALQRDILQHIEDQRIPYYAAQAGQTLRIGRSLKAYVLSPGEQFLAGTRNDADNNSVVMRFVFGKIKFLFPGDIQREAEAALIAGGRDLESNVMKVSHHGANDASCLELLRLVKPDYVVISVGEDNSYRYPHKAALRRLSPERLGAQLFRTDRDGTVVITTDGNSVLVETER